MALAFREHGDQDVGAGDLFPPGRLDMDRRALKHPLETGGGLRLARLGGNQVGQLVADIVIDLVAQPLDRDAAGPQHRDGVLILGQGQQQVFERRVLVAPLIGQSEGTMQRLF